jgi:hypothetical protein
MHPASRRIRIGKNEMDFHLIVDADTRAVSPTVISQPCGSLNSLINILLINAEDRPGQRYR